MILGLKQKFGLFYGTTIFAVVIFMTSLVITVFNFHLSSMNLLPHDAMERIRWTYIAIGLIFIPVGALFSYIVGWIISMQLHSGRYTITPRAVESPPPPVAMLEGEFQAKMGSIRSSVEKMREAYDQIQHFSVNASHELRTPLTIMRGEVELALRNPKSAGQYQAILGSLLEEILRLSRILDDLLLVARAQLGQVPMDRTRIDLGQLIEEMVDEIEMFTEHSGIAFELGGTEQAWIVGDALRIRRILLNLVDNAVKYNRPGGTVTLSLVNDGEYAQISVRDTGIGIPAESLPRVFERFYRVDREHSKSQGGTGLGLYLVQWIAETHGGGVSVESEYGNGSTFTVRLPLEDGHAAAWAPVEQAEGILTDD